MTFHHVGCLVENISETIKNYTLLFNGSITASKIYDVPDQKIKACFINLSENNFIELIEPYADNKYLNKILKVRKTKFYHIAFRVDDVDKEVNRLVENGYRIASSLHSEAFDHKKCVFLFSPELQLIELIEN